MYLSRAHCISPKRLALWMPYLLLNLYTYWKGPRNHQLRQCLPKCCKRTHGSLYVPACDSRCELQNEQCIASWQFQLQSVGISIQRPWNAKWTPNSANMDTWHLASNFENSGDLRLPITVEKNHSPPTPHNQRCMGLARIK